MNTLDYLDVVLPGCAIFGMFFFCIGFLKRTQTGNVEQDRRGRSWIIGGLCMITITLGVLTKNILELKHDVRQLQQPNRSSDNAMNANQQMHGTADRRP